MRNTSGVRSLAGGFSARSIAVSGSARSITGTNLFYGGSGSGSGGIEKTIPYEIEVFKRYLFDVLISPLVQSKEEYLKKNVYLLYILKNRFEELKIKYEGYDFDDCEDTIELIDVAFNQYDVARKYEKILAPNEGVANISVQIERVILKAEYEIYHIIYGYPDIKCKETYNTELLDAIKSIIYNELKRIYTFDEVKQQLIELGLLKDENNDNQHDDQLLHHYPISK